MEFTSLGFTYGEACIQRVLAWIVSVLLSSSLEIGVLPSRIILLGLRNRFSHGELQFNQVKYQYITFQEWNRAGPKNLTVLLKQHFTVSQLKKNLRVVEIQVTPSRCSGYF